MKKDLSPKQEKLFNNPCLDELKKRFQLEPIPSAQASINHRIEMTVDQILKEVRSKILVLLLMAAVPPAHTTTPTGKLPPVAAILGNPKIPTGGVCNRKFAFYNIRAKEYAEFRLKTKST
jgi:hypothetical protein